METDIKGLSASTILELISNNKLKRDEDLLLLLSKDTDLDLLLRGLYHNSCWSTNIPLLLKYMLLHYPEAAKKFLYEIGDLDQLNSLLYVLSIDLDTYKNSTDDDNDFIRNEVRFELISVIDNYLKALRDIMQNQREVLISNHYLAPGVIPERFKRYINEVLKVPFITKKDIKVTSLEPSDLIKHFTPTPMVVCDFFNGIKAQMTFPISIEFWVPKALINIKGLKSYNRLKKEDTYLDTAIEGINFVKIIFDLNFGKDGTVVDISEYMCDITTKKNGSTMISKAPLNPVEQLMEKNDYSTIKQEIVEEGYNIVKKVYKVPSALKKIKVNVYTKEVLQKVLKQKLQDIQKEVA